MNSARRRVPFEMVVASSEADPCSTNYIICHVTCLAAGSTVHNSKSCASQLSPLELSLPTIQRNLIDRTK